LKSKPYHFSSVPICSTHCRWAS